MPTCCIWIFLLIGTLLNWLKRTPNDETTEEGHVPSHLYEE